MAIAKGFLIFKETKIIAVIERNEDMRRGIEGTYTVEGNRIIITGSLLIPHQNEARWAMVSLRLMVTSDDHMALDASDVPNATSRRYISTPRPTRRWSGPPPVNIYESDRPNATSRRDMSTPLVNGRSTGNL